MSKVLTTKTMSVFDTEILRVGRAVRAISEKGYTDGIIKELGNNFVSIYYITKQGEEDDIYITVEDILDGSKVIELLEPVKTTVNI